MSNDTIVQGSKSIFNININEKERTEPLISVSYYIDEVTKEIVFKVFVVDHDFALISLDFVVSNSNGVDVVDIEDFNETRIPLEHGENTISTVQLVNHGGERGIESELQQVSTKYLHTDGSIKDDAEGKQEMENFILAIFVGTTAIAAGLFLSFSYIKKLNKK